MGVYIYILYIPVYLSIYFPFPHRWQPFPFLFCHPRQCVCNPLLRKYPTPPPNPTPTRPLYLVNSAHTFSPSPSTHPPTTPATPTYASGPDTFSIFEPYHASYVLMTHPRIDDSSYVLMTHPLRFFVNSRALMMSCGTLSVPSRFCSKLPHLCSRLHIPMTHNITPGTVPASLQASPSSRAASKPF